MSSAHAHAHHDAGPPVPPEPNTPNWMPALGAALFFAVGVWWLATPSSTPAQAATAVDAGAAADSSPPGAPPAPH